MSAPSWDRLPVLALRDLVFFPHMVLPLLVGRTRSLNALAEARTEEGLLAVVAQKDPEVDEPVAADLHRTGTLVRVLEVSPLDDGTHRAVFEGLHRIQVERFIPSSRTFRGAARRWDPFPLPDEGEGRVLLRRVERLFQEYARLHDQIPGEVADTLLRVEDPERELNLLAGHLLVPTTEKQRLLESEGVAEGLRRVEELLGRELEVIRIEEELDHRIRHQMDEDRRRFYLQEQLKAIHEELGGEAQGEWGELEESVTQTHLPDHARERAERELSRLRKMNPAAPEAAVIRTYLDWILSLPWSTRTPDNPDVSRAEEVLEEEHHGLEEVKDRILEYIAVLSLVRELKGPILCLVGPPGVGKTSLGRSIARALGREFVRVSLGGIRDEAEIRGHRRTYVGALPGRILQGMRRSGSRNPVFLLDEVDKVSHDGHGDPGAALLEVLDPEQNRTFTDHYLELEFDLTSVLFVATANTLAGIPEPLRDRMEVIRIPGYLDTEKREIVRRFLLPRQVERHGLPPAALELTPEAIQTLIQEYTREAGVRELERSISKLARKVARRIASGRAGAGEEEATSHLTPGDVRTLLGPPPFRKDGDVEGDERVGIANGLAWTPAGGAVLEVEVVVVPGSGRIQLTGTLGDVMKESAVAALTFARSRAAELGLEGRFHEEADVHIHIPEGATPKDGPSAGLTMAVGLISSLTGRPTRTDTAMTGEITLRGRVLPVGGIREKAVAAVRAGLGTFLLPQGNEGELERLPAEVRNRLEFVPVRTVDEALELTLIRRPGLEVDAPPGKDLFGGSSDAGVRISQ